MKALFISASMTELKKNFMSIADYFKSKDESFEAVFVNVDTSSYTVKSIEEESYRILVSKGYEVKTIRSFNRNKIRRKLKEINPDYLFSVSMNVGNELWNSICKESNIPVYLYPHGFQIDNLFYHKKQLLGKYIKLLRYTYCLYNISKEINRPFPQLFKAYVNYIGKGSDMKGTALDDPRLYPNVVFIYSEHYKGFWERKYGIRNINYEYIMPHDFSIVEQVLAEPEEDAACYITQTLHQDGRLSDDEYKELINSLRPVANAVNKLYVKLHPRVESTDYEKVFKGLDNVEITRDFPHCKCYFTHYSSMAYLSALISGKTIIYELPGQPTHDVFKTVATEIVQNVPELVEALKRQMNLPEKPFEERIKIISKYATYTGVSPYEVLYKTVYNKY